MTLIRKTLAAFAAVAFCFLVVGAAAHAGETTGEEGETGTETEAEAEEIEAEITEVGECVEEAVEAGTDPADCQEAPNPILPEVNEILWGFAAFLVLLVIMWKFALPPVRKGMADRTERIRSDLDRADTAKAEAEQVLAGYNAQLADARAEAT